MKKFMLLHVGFEKPTAEIMESWKQWFESIADRSVEHGGFHGGALEITSDGTEELTMGPDAITGYSIVLADSLEEAEAIARDNPFITSIRVYEISES